MKKMSILLMAGCLVFTAALVTAAVDKGPEAIQLPASMGEISFDHGAHQARVSQCQTCHHQDAAEVTPVACHSCHGTKAEIPTAKNAFHQQCKTCHQAQGGPTKCKECHTGSKG